ncbi:MAG TPA: hypothetical protein VFH56_07320 [Acidimicrobiales bacterium]|nr:hypothetical protein [Acidimicrobiales bacterium]
MTLPEPTMGEVMRRLDEVARQMTELAREMKDDRAAAAATFVRQDVYIAQRHADQAVTSDVATDVISLRREMESVEAKRVATLRWAIGTVLIPIGLALLALVVALQGGAPT